MLCRTNQCLTDLLTGPGRAEKTSRFSSGPVTTFSNPGSDLFCLFIYPDVASQGVFTEVSLLSHGAPGPVAKGRTFCEVSFTVVQSALSLLPYSLQLCPRRTEMWGERYSSWNITNLYLQQFRRLPFRSSRWCERGYFLCPWVLGVVLFCVWCWCFVLFFKE